MENIVGRSDEAKILGNALSSNSAELIAVYGRRRVGKTFLVRTVYEKNIVFEFSAVHNANMKEQLEGFMIALSKALKSPARLAAPDSWMAAFQLLEEYLAPIIKKRKAVVFFDEFPWMHTHKSNFLKAFEHFWNSYASKYANLTIVICGSAASWMIQNILNNKGGLHNRVTIRIRLLPFTLHETEQYLRSRNIIIDRYQILQTYMAMGGIPEYLKNIRPGESAAQAIDRAFFAKQGILKEEFNNLYPALFENATNHITIIRTLSKMGKGMTRNEIIARSGLSSGGTTTKVLTELEQSGFITFYVPYEKTLKESVFRLIDEYSLFYLKYIEKNRASGPGSWARISKSPSWQSWSGYAFEAICLKHISGIRKSLGIEHIYTEESVWRVVPGNGSPGAQIDLLLDRGDYCINICEMKFTTGELVITKKYAEELQRKKQVFINKVKPKKTVFITMITTYGVSKNQHSKGLVQSELTMDALFD